MKDVTLTMDYDELLNTLEYEVVIEVDDNNYQGDSYRLYRDGENYGLLIFGWGSCSGCDTLQNIVDGSWGSGSKNKNTVLAELREFRDELNDKIVWRSRQETKEYILTKDFSLEYYYYHPSGRQFVKMVREYFTYGLDD